MTLAGDDDGKKEAVKTYIEQTKLLVTLASAFILAPAGLIAILKDRVAAGLTSAQLVWFVVAEVLFITSVLAGYVVLGSISGYQAQNRYDVFRPATRFSSLFQFVSYLAGLGVFIVLAYGLVTSAPPVMPKS